MRLDDLLASLKRAAAALQKAGIPFALGGGLAAYAYGGPESNHDVDLMVRESDAKAAQDVLAEEGMKPADPPEDWLLKSVDGDVTVDLIFRPVGVPIDDGVLARCQERTVQAMSMLVLPLEDVLTTQLLAMDEHHMDFVGLLRIVRAIREQVDWDDVRRRTAESPFARAFFTMVEGLQLVPPGAA